MLNCKILRSVMRNVFFVEFPDAWLDHFFLFEKISFVYFLSGCDGEVTFLEENFFSRTRQLETNEALVASREFLNFIYLNLSHLSVDCSECYSYELIQIIWLSNDDLRCSRRFCQSRRSWPINCTRWRRWLAWLILDVNSRCCISVRDSFFRSMFHSRLNLLKFLTTSVSRAVMPTAIIALGRFKRSAFIECVIACPTRAG